MIVGQATGKLINLETQLKSWKCKKTVFDLITAPAFITAPIT